MPDPIKGKKKKAPVKKFTDLRKAQEELSPRDRNRKSIEQRYPNYKVHAMYFDRKKETMTYALHRKGDASDTLSVTPGPVYDKHGKCVRNCNGKQNYND